MSSGDLHRRSNAPRSTDFSVDQNAICRHLVDLAIEVQRIPSGSGWLASVSLENVATELQQRGLEVEYHVALPRPDTGPIFVAPPLIVIVVSDLLIVGCKAVNQSSPLCDVQTLTYLRLCNHKLGVAVSFGEKVGVSGTLRVVNG